MLIRVYAGYKRFIIPDGPPGASGQYRWIPLTNGQFRLNFKVDGVVVHTSTNGGPPDPF